MSAEDQGEDLKELVFKLQTQIKHLKNELRLTRQEYETSTKNYFELYSNMERTVAERTRESKALQERIARAEKMEALGLLAGGVAHDGNNILAGIVGYLELMQATLNQDDSHGEYLEGAIEAAHQMGSLIQDLLTITRGGLEEKLPISLNSVVRNFVASPTFHEIEKSYPELDISVNLADDLLNVRGDVHALTKATTNLLTNAAEACRSKGRVSVTTANRYIDSLAVGQGPQVGEGEYVVLRVQDDGVGIAEEDLGRIFEPFFTKKVMGRSGTGLGMTLVYRTMKDHEGAIDVCSEENVGTTFDLYFPATRQEVQVQEADVPLEKLVGRGERILVVDDIPAQRTILTDFLTRLGYRVTAASSGEEAIELLQEQPVDLMILDMIMEPGIDGLETYRRALKLRTDQRAVIASGFAETDRVHEARRLGAGAFVRKPYTFERIGLAVKAELEREAD